MGYGLLFGAILCFSVQSLCMKQYQVQTAGNSRAPLWAPCLYGLFRSILCLAVNGFQFSITWNSAICGVCFFQRGLQSKHAGSLSSWQDIGRHYIFAAGRYDSSCAVRSHRARGDSTAKGLGSDWSYDLCADPLKKEEKRTYKIPCQLLYSMFGCFLCQWLDQCRNQVSSDYGECRLGK